ncbi:MAG TPA: helix-turn-helix transcriptional regulator [Rhizomicrobium sp.]|nr:helix-turn-helix transcriptional regulator [Rhizomicrobium sp.]
MPKANTHAIDKAIGGRLKMYRQRANISQTALGKHLGVSFQQVQKYENGTNRVSAATLIKISRFLNISVGELMVLDGQQTQSASSSKDLMRFAKSSEGKSLLSGFMAIEDSLLRRHIVGLVKALGR